MNNTFIDKAEDLDIVMLMYNLLEYSGNYSMTSGNLWNYYRHEVNDSANENNDTNNYRTNNNKTTTSKYFEYKTSLIGSTPINNNGLKAEVVFPFKYLSNFWRSLDLVLVNCEIKLDLTWSKYCVTSGTSKSPEVERANPADETLTTGATFQINNAKLYVQVVTKQITKQPTDNNFDYLIDPSFRNINRLFILSFKNGNNKSFWWVLHVINRNHRF